VLRLTGTVEVRPADDLGATPVTFPLEAAARLTVVPVPGTTVDDVTLRYDGVDGTPTPPVTIDRFMTSHEVQQVLNSTRLPLAANLVAGLNQSRLADSANPPPDSAWAVRLTLTPAGRETVDAFAVSVGPPGTTAALGTIESFMAPRTRTEPFAVRVLVRDQVARLATET
jgi:hypothetical protein